MSRINPEVLRAERERKGWSLEDLARRSRIDPQSIHRIEKGGQKRNRKKVISDLARALGVSEDILTGATAPSLPEKGMDEIDELLSESQLNLRVSNLTRNALSLTANRYGVTHAQIVEIAPLLFCWAAEMSLQRRRNRLNDLKQKYEEISQIGEAFPHLHFRAFINANAEHTLAAEAKSIEAHDIFGATIGGDSYESYLSDRYDESEDNPMTVFLKELVSKLSDTAEFGYWFADSGPNYRICKKEALELVGGDEEAAEHILSGHAPLHKLPKELRECGKESGRAEWVRQQGKQWLDTALDLSNLGL